MKSLIRAELTRGDTGSFDISIGRVGQSGANGRLGNSNASLQTRLGQPHGRWRNFLVLYDRSSDEVGDSSFGQQFLPILSQHPRDVLPSFPSHLTTANYGTVSQANTCTKDSRISTLKA